MISPRHCPGKTAILGPLFIPATVPCNRYWRTVTASVSTPLLRVFSFIGIGWSALPLRPAVLLDHYSPAFLSPPPCGISVIVGSFFTLQLAGKIRISSLFPPLGDCADGFDIFVEGELAYAAAYRHSDVYEFKNVCLLAPREVSLKFENHVGARSNVKRVKVFLACLARSKGK